MKKLDIGKLISELSKINIMLWHEEDKARLPDDHVVAQAKRNIDKLNQKRNDFIEMIDEKIAGMLKNGGNYRKSNR